MASHMYAIYSILLVVATAWTAFKGVASKNDSRVIAGPKLKCAGPLICILFIVQAAVEHAQLRLHHDSDSPFGCPPTQQLGACTDQQSLIMCSILSWSVLSILIGEVDFVPWSGYIISLTTGAIIDATQLYLTPPTHNLWYAAQLCVYSARLLVVLVAIALILLQLLKANTNQSSDETSSLVNGAAQVPVYSAINTADDELRDEHDGEDDENSDDEDDSEDEMKELKEMRDNRILEQGGWIGYLRGFATFLPYILPYNDRPTQVWYIVSLLCLAAQRALTLFIPRQLAILIQALTLAAGQGTVPWKEFIVWAVLQFPLEATVDLFLSVSNTRIDQFSHYQLRSVAFSHVINLSMDYHTSKSTGKIVRAIEQGSNLATLIDMVIGAGSMVLDLVIAVIYLTHTFDITLGFIVLVTSLLSIYLSVKGNQITGGIERKVADKSRQENTVLYDSITNWYTVVIHNRGTYETKRYLSVVKDSMLTLQRYLDWSNILHNSDKAMLTMGLFVAGYIVASRVVDGQASVGDFIFLVTYWQSVTEPVSAIAWMYHNALETLINAEWLYQLVQTVPSVQDKPNALPISIISGKVEFKDVHFAYDAERPILRNVSFTAQPGQSIALVGETGSGKTTLLKLLWRFYDPTQGSVSIDGQDVRDVTLDSLRDCLGAVPQDPSVFDVTIMENLLYARAGATPHQVYEACKAARIHDQIVSFPEGYQSKIGERGVRLSGGELQRLAIARVILRAPKIVMLDEATSAVDSDTEASVQAAIKSLSKGRTVFTVAHRLSTVIQADAILVVDAGQIVESGTHDELLKLNGKYSRLWRMQTATRRE